MIETAVEIMRGVVPEPSSLRMHSETFRLRNHPSRHRKERDDAALLTQEGISHAFTVSVVFPCFAITLPCSTNSAPALFQCGIAHGITYA
jgi:hypothetical protein